MRKNIFMLLLAASVLSGCADSDVDLKTVGGAEALKTDLTLLEMDQNGSTFSIQVFAADNIQWQAAYSSDTDWLHIDNEGQTYSGNGSITGSVSENPDPAERSAMFEIRALGTFGSSIATVGLTVIQYGTQPFVRIMDLNNNQLDEYKTGSSHSTFTIRVVSNVRWGIESDAEWIRILTPEGLSGEGSANVTLEVSENTSYEKARFGYVTVTLADIPESSARVKISQEQKSNRQTIIIDGMTGYLPEGQATLLLDNEGGTSEVTSEVIDNGNRTVITLQDPVDAGTYLMQEAKYEEQAIALGGYVTISEALESGSERWDAVLKQFGGETPERPVVIDSGDDLHAISEAVNGGTSYAGIHLSQSCDLSLAAFENWEPIGCLDSPFKGLYHGNGHAIIDLTIQSTESNVGLFGCMTGESESPAVIEGINLQGTVVCTGSGAGCIVGRAMNHSVIRNCVNNATWDFSGGCSGGIVGVCTSDNSMAINQNRLDNILVENCRTVSSGRFAQKNDNAGIVGFMKGNIDFSSHFNTSRKLDWWHDRKLSEESGYATTLLNEYAAEFIAESDERPFFLYVPHAAIHVPMQGPTDPPVRTEGKYRYRNDVTMSAHEYARRYREMVASIDEGVGMLLDKLEKTGKMDNTIIIFISDNGAEQIAADKYPGANGIYRGAKGSLYEGGIRVPAIFYWKDRIRPSVNDDFMMSMDLFPTILEVCGIRYDHGATDGKTLVEAIIKGKSMPERKMFWANKGICAMKDSNFKCVWTKNQVELFDISADPEEKHDLGKEYPGKVKSMQKSIVRWWNEVTKGNRLEGYSIFDLEIPLSKQKEK